MYATFTKFWQKKIPHAKKNPLRVIAFLRAVWYNKSI